MADRRQILSFDVLRALAALVVMISHVRNVFLADLGPRDGFWTWAFYVLTNFGHPAVIIFFVLSGYWITKVVVERREAGTFGWGGYLLDRLSRLWVVLLPALCLGALLDFVTFQVLRFPPAGYTSESIPSDVVTHFTLPYFAANAVFVQGLWAPAFGSNGPLWSLANEFWYYLWFPALYIAFTTRKVSVALVLAVFTALMFRPFLPGFACWLCGSALYLASRRFPRPSLLVSGVGWAAVAIIFVLDRGSGDNVRDIALALACILPFWRARDWSMDKVAPLAAYGAGSSYSLYVVHFPLLALTAALFGLRQRIPPTLAAVCGCVALGLALAFAGWAFSQLTERHTRRVRQALAGLAAGLTTGRPRPSEIG
jgi:peptidoglycan/LPS O-acetylase OafA/YrhL